MTRNFSTEKLVALRRDLHAHPELSHHEERTAGVVVDELRALGLEPRTGIAGHGVMADIVGDSPGPTLLYRADMDALPIQEVDGRDWGSQRPGVMHACGHDVHTSIGLGVASQLTDWRDRIHGRVRMVFQPAEEAAPPPGEVIGAEKMVEEGVLQNPAVDAAFALHVMPSIPVGTIAGTGGPVWAGSDLFDITVRGRMSHGAWPHEGRDAILAASHLVSALQQIVSREIDARRSCVVSVGRIAGGSTHNVIAEEVTLSGLVRTLDDESRKLALHRVVEIAEATAKAHRCEADVTFVRGAHRTANHPELEAAVLELVRESGAAEEVTRALPLMGAEDFAAFSRRVPSCYLFLGVRNEARGIVHPIHTPGFDVDEAAMPLAVEAMTYALLKVGRRWPEFGVGAAKQGT